MKNMPKQIKLIVLGVAALLGIIVLTFFNPFAWNDAGQRTVVERMNGEQFVQYTPGIYYAGFFAKTTEWPNQISVSYQNASGSLSEVVDGTIDIGKINIRFNDATTADVSGIVQYILPTDEKEMIAMHNAHRTPQSLVSKRLAPYTKECLQSSAQLMSSEMHYGGGRAQMAQDFGDQLRNGVFLLFTKEILQYDSLERENKRIYQTQIQMDKNNNIKRKQSSIKEYGITVTDAAITDVDYEKKVDEMLAKKIDAATKASISKQELMTAQQQALTAKAQGEKTLVETEYKQKIKQTELVVAANTQVQLSEQNRQKQEIDLKSAKLESEKIKTLADANAYDKQKAMMANGALEQKLDAYKEINKYWADAFKGYQGNVVPLYQTGGQQGGNAASSFMELMMMKSAKDLNLDMKTK